MQRAICCAAILATALNAVGAATAAPTAELAQELANVTEPGATRYRINIQFLTAAGIDFTTFGTTDIEVVGPGGAIAPASINALQQGSKSSTDPAIDGNGRFVSFRTSSADLIGGDSNGVNDIYLHDRNDGQTRIISLGPGGALASAASGRISIISSDGCRVAFESVASDLVVGDDNGQQDIFLYDCNADSVNRVSVDTSGGQLDSASQWPAISADGDFVAYASIDPNIVAGDSNGLGDVFVITLDSGAVDRVSVASDEQQSVGGPSLEPALSADGRFVVFESAATNLVGDDDNGLRDFFVRDRVAGSTERVGVCGNPPSNDDVCSADISGDGRFVVFSAVNSNGVAGANNSVHIYLHDRQEDTTVLLSGRYDDAGSLLETGNDRSLQPTISDDGGTVAFVSAATNLGPPDSKHQRDIYVYSVATGELDWITPAFDSTDSIPKSANGSCFNPSASDAGRYIAFNCWASDLLDVDGDGFGDDKNGSREDIFVYDRQNAVLELISANGVGPLPKAIVSYSIEPPGGSWDAADNGTYQVMLRGSEVADSLGETAAPTALGSFEVNLTRLIEVNPTSGLRTSERGDETQFGVRLGVTPTAEVTIPLGISDSREGRISLSELKFNSTNWNVQQFVTVFGKNDDDRDGDYVFRVLTEPAVSADPTFNGVDAEDVEVTNEDDDNTGPALFITYSDPFDKTTREDGSANRLLLKLVTRPGSAVSVAVASEDASEARVSPTTLVFTTENWSTPQAIVASGRADGVTDGDQTYTVSATSSVDSPGDEAYANRTAQLTLTNEDVPGLEVEQCEGDCIWQSGFEQ